MLNKFTELKLPLTLKQLKYCVYLICAIIFVIIVLGSMQNGAVVWPLSAKSLGQFAWWLLVYTIYVSLLSKLFSSLFIFRQLYPLRKYTGLLAFLFAGLHGLFMLMGFGALTSLSGVYQVATASPANIAGATALLIMIPLAVTSLNYFLIKLGGKKWKLLHKLTHLAFILVAGHAAFVRFAIGGSINYLYLILIVIYLLGYAVVFVKRTKRITVIPSETTRQSGE